jgi:putative ABC transport system ATP-binding protein
MAVILVCLVIFWAMWYRWGVIVQLHNIWKTYTIGKLTLDALRGIDLEISEGDFVALAGPSGSGKSTAMNIIGLIDTPTQGSVTINGKDAGGLGREERTKLRQSEIGFVFQSFNLLPVLNVYENVELPLLLGANPPLKAERRAYIEELLEHVGLEDRMRHTPSELSGGQQQRVAIARALVCRPKIVIADEPTANLDSANGERILNLMKRVNRQDGTTFIFSTHDSTIWEMANHIIFLHDGLIRSEKRQ